MHLSAQICEPIITFFLLSYNYHTLKAYIYVNSFHKLIDVFSLI